MGCDIHSSVEVFDGAKWEAVTDAIFPLSYPWAGHTHTRQPFDWRSYGMFAFLAGVRNYSYVSTISEPRGWPEDRTSFLDRDLDDYHSRSWLSVKELLDFDYDRNFEDRRCMIDGNGAADAGVGNGKIVTMREFLGPDFMRDLEIMKSLSPDPAFVRIVFAFDN